MAAARRPKRARKGDGGRGMNGRHPTLTDAQIAQALRAHLPERADRRSAGASSGERRNHGPASADAVVPRELDRCRPDGSAAEPPARSRAPDCAHPGSGRRRRRLARLAAACTRLPLAGATNRRPGVRALKLRSNAAAAPGGHHHARGRTDQGPHLRPRIGSHPIRNILRGQCDRARYVQDFSLRTASVSWL